MEYKVVCEHLCTLEETVQALLDEGWRLYGGLVVSVEPDGVYYYREMVRDTVLQAAVDAMQKQLKADMEELHRFSVEV